MPFFMFLDQIKEFPNYVSEIISTADVSWQSTIVYSN